MANPLSYKIETYNNGNYTLLLNPIGWSLADLEAYAASYAQMNNVTVTVWRAYEDWNSDGTKTTYSQS